MKGGGFVVFLFLLVCFLWGVTAVVGSLRASVRSWFSKPEPVGSSPDIPSTQAHDASPPASAAQKTAITHGLQVPSPKATSLQRDIDALRALFALHQQGVLTQQEFEQFK